MKDKGTTCGSIIDGADSGRTLRVRQEEQERGRDYSNGGGLETGELCVPSDETLNRQKAPLEPSA